jgi:hypothetical protein
MRIARIELALDAAAAFIRGEARESELAGRLTGRAAQALLDANLFSMLGRPCEWPAKMGQTGGGRK